MPADPSIFRGAVGRGRRAVASGGGGLGGSEEGGQGGLATLLDYPVGARPSGITRADVNGDGTLDLVTASFDGDSVNVFLNGAFAIWLGVPGWRFANHPAR